MRIYYIFFIEDAFLLLYKDRPSMLYKNFYEIYRMNNENIGMGLKIYSQLISPYNKNKINEYIYIRHKNELSYSNSCNTHIINNKYTNELTKLTIYNTYLKIRTNRNCPYFFNVLYNINKNLFICDFSNHDYFWINENLTKMLV